MAIGAPYVASSSPSASQDVGQKVMQDWLNLGGGPERELTHGRTINDACPQRPCVAHCTLAGQRESAPCEAIARRVKTQPANRICCTRRVCSRAFRRRALHELAFTRRSSPERLSPANEASNAPSLVPAPSPIDRLVLDAGLDFVFHRDGTIELTEAGFRRMGQAHSAGLDTVIEVDRRYLLRFPASPAR